MKSAKTWLRFFIILVIWSNPLTTFGGIVSGAMEKWRPVTIDFVGPLHSESDSAPNPFLDYRLQVAFTHENSGTSYSVPGFFDGDGNGRGTGNIWRVKFAPDQEGEWSYSASFRSEPNIAVSLDPIEGDPVWFDGDTGGFNISEPVTNATLFFKHGRLESIGKHYFKFRDGGFWLKQGMNSPENFLGYSGFDNTPYARHSYSAHIQHWQPGDPDWDSPYTNSTTNDGQAIIGALNYLSSQNINSIYFMPMNIGGDGKDTWPYASETINPDGSSANDNLHFDISKLYQWNIVLTHAQEMEIFLHFVLSESEVAIKNELDNATLGVERKLFYRELNARFGHHNALQWNISEEYNSDLPLDPNVIKEFARYIKDSDPYDHQITVHNHGNTYIEALSPFVGDDRFSVLSIQTWQQPDDIGYAIDFFRSATSTAGIPVPCSVDESIGIDQISFDAYRKRAIWDAYFSGGMQELFVRDKDTSLEDYSQFETLYQYFSISRQFVEANLPFWEMEPSDQLISGENPIYGGAEVFSKSGIIYAVYLPSADPTPTIDLSGIDGKFNKSWFNPRNGGFEGETEIVSAGGLLSIGSPPSSNQEDWVVLLTVDTCSGDINFDKDVDGKDIADNILNSGGLDLDVFANNFGKVNCP